MKVIAICLSGTLRGSDTNPTQNVKLNNEAQISSALPKLQGTEGNSNFHIVAVGRKITGVSEKWWQTFGFVRMTLNDV